MGARHNSPEYIDLDWKQDAACRGLDPDLFFSTSDAESEAAIRVCGQCAVRSACLEYALITNEQYGIWGGVTEVERRKIRSSWLKGRAS